MRGLPRQTVVVLAVAVSFGIISSQSGTPEPVDEPLVTYGERQ